MYFKLLLVLIIMYISPRECANLTANLSFVVIAVTLRSIVFHLKYHLPTNSNDGNKSPLKSEEALSPVST